MKYKRARDQQGKPIRCPRCNGWLFELDYRGEPHVSCKVKVFCVDCDWLGTIEEEDSDVETNAAVEGAE